VDLVSALARCFNLQVEGCADPLHLTDVLPRYASPWEEDRLFGAEHDVFKLDLSGTNTYINPPFSGKKAVNGKPTHVIEVLLRRWAAWCQGDVPTRAVFLIPEPDQPNGREFLGLAESLGGFCFLSFSKGSFGFLPTNAFASNSPVSPGPYSGKVHFVLFQNKAAAGSFRLAQS